MLVRLGFCGLMMAALCACSGGVEGGGSSSSGSGGESSTTGGGGSSTAGTGGSAPAACTSAALCDGVYLPSSCDAFGSGSSSGSGGAPPDAMAAADMRCVLTKLRDHEVGYMSLFVEAHTNTGCGIRTEIVSFGDGTASVQDIHWADIGVTPGTPVRATLKDKAFFDACLAGSDDGLAACVTAITTGAAAAGPTCPCRGVPGAQDGQCKSPF